jgi:hypothetical protein
MTLPRPVTMRPMRKAHRLASVAVRLKDHSGSPNRWASSTGHPLRILAGHHRGDPTVLGNALLHGSHGGSGRMTGHGPRVPEGEVHVLVAVDVRHSISPVRRQDRSGIRLTTCSSRSSAPGRRGGRRTRMPPVTSGFARHARARSPSIAAARANRSTTAMGTHLPIAHRDCSSDATDSRGRPSSWDPRP